MYVNEFVLSVLDRNEYFHDGDAFDKDNLFRDLKQYLERDEHKIGEIQLAGPVKYKNIKWILQRDLDFS